MSFRTKAAGKVAKTDLKKFEDFSGTWEQYKKYLYDNDALSPNLKHQFESKQIAYQDKRFIE